jgi:hypothetical protein
MADVLPEKWMKVMASTVTALAVVASIAGSRASFYISKAQFLAAQEQDQWSYFQAKSIKQDIFLLQENSLKTELLGLTTPEQKKLIEQTLQNSTGTISRYDQEKKDIQKKAASLDADNVKVTRRGTQFSLAVVFAQTAIMLSSLGVLLNRRKLWIFGIVLGVISLFFIINGFLLFY